MGTQPLDDGDAALLRAVAAGDEASLQELYERHSAWLFLRLLRRCDDPDLVTDVLQDTFLAVWRGAAAWRGDGEVAAWIWGIGARRLVSRLRHRASPVPVPDDRLDGVGEQVISAEESVLLGVEHGDLAAALGRLSPELRAVIQATLLDGLTTREAARLLQLPQGTVKGRVRRAKELLRMEISVGRALGSPS